MDPTPETLVVATSGSRIPRKMPVPEGPPGPPAIDVRTVAAPVMQQAERLLEPLPAGIADIIRGALNGAPEALRIVMDNAPPPKAVFTAAGAATGLASLVTGVSGPAAALLAAPAAGVPYVGPALTTALAAWGNPMVSGGVSAAFGAASAGFNALAQGQPFPMPDLSQWGKIQPPNPAAAQKPPQR